MSINYIDIKLIGVNAYSGETALLADLATASGYISSDLQSCSINLTPELSGDTKEYLNNMKVKTSTIILTGEIYLNPKIYPKISTGLTYYDFLAPLQKQFLYLYSADYNIYLNTVANTAYRINPTGLNYETTSNGLIKSWKLNFEFGSYL